MARADEQYIAASFARFLAARTSFSEDERPPFAALVAKLMAMLLEGHSCLVVSSGERQLLLGSGLVGDGDGGRPLVLVGSRLYLQRYFGYESRLAERLCDLRDQGSGRVADEAQLERLFGPKPDEGIDWQREAADKAAQQMLTIISGGPGTGKTTTVVKILALLLELYSQPLTIELAAPTGKAAMRLQESVQASVETLAVSEVVRRAIPTVAKTLHRLLGVQFGTSAFRHNRANPLPCDVLVVDEASMVDLALMSKLVESLKPGGRLILLGDKDQLVSVESGAVLGDLIAGLPENTVVLQKSYRFNRHIKDLADAVNGGDAEQAYQLLAGAERENLALLSGNPVEYAGVFYLPYMARVQGFSGSEHEVGELFALFNRFRVLCAVRRGPRGVEGLNQGIELHLARRGFPCRSGQWYPGRPVMISQNDYSLNLYNGDVGLCLQAADGTLQVWFEREGGIVPFAPFRLPRCETVFAMTIHKSQGSEFREVLVSLPPVDSPVLSRELLYTGITRAKERVVVDCARDIFLAAVNRPTTRYTGLAGLLADT